jgi:hypothetical protein
VEAILTRLVPTGFTAEDRGAALVTFEDALERAALSALATSGEGPSSVVDALAEGDGTFEPFVGPQGGTPAAHDAARAIARGLEPQLVPFAREPNPPAMRARVLVLLARSSNPAAVEAVEQALADPNETVQRTALSAIGAVGAKADANAVKEVARILSVRDENWAVRVLAAQAMGRLGGAGAKDAAGAALRGAATGDAYALVREAALRALASFDASAARPLAHTMATTDPEPRVRDAALRIATTP